MVGHPFNPVYLLPLVEVVGGEKTAPNAIAAAIVVYQSLGMRHFMSQFGPALKLPWTKLEAPELTDALIDKVVDGTSAQLGSHSIADLERYRDDCLMAVQEAIRVTKIRYGIALDE